MFELFQAYSTKKLEKHYARRIEEARDLQRSAKIRLFATPTAEAEEIGERLDGLEQGG